MKADVCFLVLWLLLTAGCAGLDGQQSTTPPGQGTAEEVRLKAVLLESEAIAGSAIDITIEQGRILLEGFVETAAQRQRVEALVRENSDRDITNRVKIK